MITLLSPSKTQDFESKPSVATYTEPALLKESAALFKYLRKLSIEDISALMQVSLNIASLNHERYKHLKTPFTPANAKQAAFAFKGDVYDGLMAESFDEKTLDFAQDHVRILSGLYGALRPLDLIQPYRLEMKIRLANARGGDLYRFWEDRITLQLNKALAATQSKFVVNLASQEYFKAVNTSLLEATVITPQFRQQKGSDYPMIALFAKRARGAMARYIAMHQITDPEALKHFAEDGYRYHAKLSSGNAPVFTRK